MDWKSKKTKHISCHSADIKVPKKRLIFWDSHITTVLHVQAKYTVGHKIAKKKRRIFKKNVNKWVKEHRTTEIPAFMAALNRKVTGAFRYYGISGTFYEIRNLWAHAMWTSFKWLNRRSQRKSITYAKFRIVWKSYIEKPRIYRDIWGWNPA